MKMLAKMLAHSSTRSGSCVEFWPTLQRPRQQGDFLGCMDILELLLLLRHSSVQLLNQQGRHHLAHSMAGSPDEPEWIDMNHEFQDPHTNDGTCICLYQLASDQSMMTFCFKLSDSAESYIRICAGLLGQARCLQGPILSFSSRFPSSGD